jgi:uncharacterized cupin superfamily protein
MATIDDVIVRKPTDQEKKTCSIWPTWTCPPSAFDYEYDSRETCLIIEGKVTVSGADGKSVNFAAGDFVIFPEGLKCTWTVHQGVRKYYNFD